MIGGIGQGAVRSECVMADVRQLEIYDTTLRDGAQAEDVSFSVEDKVRIAQKLDELGVHFIEGGWPGANPRDIELFQAMH